MSEKLCGKNPDGMFEVSIDYIDYIYKIIILSIYYRIQIDR